MHSLRNVAALIGSITILQLAQGVLGVRLPLAFAADGYSTAALGLVAAAYSAGFMLGAVGATTLLARVGHIRVYAASAAILSVTILALHGAGDVWSWGFARLIGGVAAALMFAAVESWLSYSVVAKERGEVMGIYMVATKAAIAFGPFLAVTYAADAAEPWMIAGAVTALSLVPVCFTTAAQPDPPKAQPLALVEQFATAPAAVIACFGAGLINTGVLTLAPLFAAERYGAAAATEFYAAAWAGSLLLQWPAGRVSDRFDRRLVIAVLAGGAALCALILALLGARIPAWAGVLVFFVWGAGALSYYGIAVAHMADRADRGRLAQSTSGLLFVWASGSVIGPLIASPLVDWVGVSGVFWFAGAGGAVLAAAMFWRRAASLATEEGQKEEFAPHPATSIAAVEIAYGEDKPERL